ncbi:hypothetical protein [Streptomyces gobiensis]|nr:hypothetical protein [Streptomyces gobiensis]UGY90526.1 hypothetical protein test1122_01485 [Streptomyces gobiensis]
MSKHVHVRISRGLAVTEEGELLEQSDCRCGATWTRTYRADEGEVEQ